MFCITHVCRLIFGLNSSPSLRSGWLRCRSWHVRAGLSWVPRGKRMLSISCRSELREPKISSMPSLPIRNSVPVESDAGMSGSFSGSSWLASMERLDLRLLWMGSGWMTSPGGPWETSLHCSQLTGEQRGVLSGRRKVKYLQEVQEVLVHLSLPLDQLLPEHSKRRFRKHFTALDQRFFADNFIQTLLKYTHSRTLSSFDTLRTL